MRELMKTIRDKGYNLTGLRRGWASLLIKELTNRIDRIEQDPAEFAFYVTAVMFAADGLTGGKIPDCRGWTSSQWARSRIAFPELRDKASDLWIWEGDDLILANYDHGGDESYVGGVLKGRALTEARLRKESELARQKNNGPPPKRRRAAEAEGTAGEPAGHPHDNGKLPRTSPASIEEDLGLQR